MILKLIRIFNKLKKPSQISSQRHLKSILSHFRIVSSIISNQNEIQNRPNFITLSQITEEEQIEIIKKGFQLNQEGKISLKKYYEGTGEFISTERILNQI